MSTFRAGYSSRRLLNGAWAGLIATVPMSISMLIGWMLLPRADKYHLPPRLITEQIAERLGIEDDLSEPQLIAATVTAHFAYGALTGAGYAGVEKWLPVSPLFKGALVGLAMWVGSYLGWIPLFGILRPATQHPRERNLLMILAHLIWGATLGILMEKLNSSD